MSVCVTNRIHVMENLIANTGIQFITREVEFNPSEPMRLPSGKMLRYSFIELQNPFSGQLEFDLLYNHSDDNVWIPVRDLRDAGKLALLPGGLEDTDETGVPRMADGESSLTFRTFGDDDENIININSFESYRVSDPENPREKVPALTLLLDKWLPMPMFETDMAGHTVGVPYGWCRLRITDIGEGMTKGMRRYRMTWAFDTRTTDDDPAIYSPHFGVDDHAPRRFAICERPDMLFGFLSITPGADQIATYIASLLHIKPENIQTHPYKYIAYYIYLINFVRFSGGVPDVTLYNPPADTDVPVDMVLDIGNSRTCGVLFENGDFTKSVMLELRDLTNPWIKYDKPFDMRLVFRRADFGNDLILPDDLFNWKSIVRIGPEAKNLVYRSVENQGLSELATNYSSPKRYLWDFDKSREHWEYLITESDPFNVQMAREIFLRNFTDMFDESGRFIEDADTMSVFDMVGDSSDDCHYSRSSMMTFVLVEILQHAIAQINSPAYLERHGQRDLRRVLRRVILTSPTAMPRVEQITLRQSLVDAIKAMRRCNPAIPEIEVTPSPESLKITDDYDGLEKRQWSYDEASACQLVYLYAELAERYDNDVDRFFKARGHIRPEFVEEGYDRPSLTIGSIDIGAGTTDIMICSYKYDGDGVSRVTPIPHFYDSFYIAGDDILHAIVRRVVIDGPELSLPDMGSIHSALLARLSAMDDAQLAAQPFARNNMVYRNKVDDIIGSHSPERRRELTRNLASVLVRDFFGRDSAMMTFNDRQARLDFNTQISVPIAQRMMDMLRLGRPTRMLSFDELFADLRPSEHLLNHFERHFGFSFTELSWRFEPSQIADIVRSTMEPLMKQLSILLYAYNCDVLVLAGRPTSIAVIPDLFIKYFPLSPDRIIRLGDYRVGSWFPFADGRGYFYDQKSVVAVGAMIGNMASTDGFNGFTLDFTQMIKAMKSTANYIGLYNPKTLQVKESLLSPQRSNASVDIAVFPQYLGAKQFDSPMYQSRPIYGLFLNGRASLPVRVTLSRSYQDDREEVTIEEATDSQGNTIPRSSIRCRMQSLVDDGKHWLDKGEFDLSL